MIFDRLAPEKAVGAFLVHSLALPKQRFKKGRVLNEADVAAIEAAGIDSVLVARLENDDMAEDVAADRIARAAQGKNCRLQAAFTGRANLYAERDGLAVIDRTRIDAINRIDEAVTIATVEPYVRVSEGQMLATVKIIPFAAPTDAVEKAAEIAADGELIWVAPLQKKRAGVIMTRLPDTRDKVLDKTADVIRERMAALGGTVALTAQCAHEREAIAAAVRTQLAEGYDPILIFGASAITDRRDEVPAGIEGAGGELLHFGMPVDPGNLLLLARADDTPVIGLPGCARSPKLNGFDWVLERVCADVPVQPEDIMAMGTGGLLKEITSRPQPRAGTVSESAAPRVARIAGLVLAAGQSRRMGEANKLLAEVDGAPMVARVLAAARASNLTHLSVVTGYQAEKVQAVVTDDDVTIHHNPNFADGLSSSLKVGLASLPDDIDGVMILLSDMPRIAPAHIDRLIAAFDPLEGRSICVPTFNGKRGNPVLFAADLIDEMRHAGGDTGAKHVIGQHEDQVCEVAMADDAIFLDIDTPDALAAYRSS